MRKVIIVRNMIINIFNTIFKNEKILLSYTILIISTGLLVILIMSPKGEHMTNGIMNILSGIVGGVTTILVQRINKKPGDTDSSSQ